MLARVKYKVFLATGDMVALVLSGIFGLYLRFEGAPPVSYIYTWLRYMVVAVPLFLVIYYYFGLYNRIWRYASAEDLVTIAGTVTLSTVALFGVMYANPGLGFPRSVFITSLFYNIAAAGGMRFSVRLLSSDRGKACGNGHVRTVILGAGDAGRILVRELAKHPEINIHVVGFLDDDKSKIGFNINGIPILGPLSKLEELVATQGVIQVIIAMPSAPAQKMRELFQRSTALGIKPRTVPGLYNIIQNCVEVSTIREVQIEDLLPRPELKTDYSGISSYLCGKTVLITGAGGSIGAELSRQVACFAPLHLLLLGRGENSIYEIHKELTHSFPPLNITPVIADVQDAQRMDSLLSQYKPQVVFHAAAHKHVPLMEQNPTEAVKNNVFGTKVVAEAASRHQAERFVLVSTDKAVNPTSVMGATKRIAEQLVQSMNGSNTTKFMAVRFGNVLGSRGSVVPRFKEQIARGGPVTVTHPEITRYFMTIPEAVSLIIQAGAMGQGGEVFILDMGAPVKIMDLAKDIITLSGLKLGQDIEIAVTGLRPGEKLYEELLTAEEGVAATQHKQIMVARQAPLGKQAAIEILLAAAALAGQQCTPQAVLALVSALGEDTLREVAAAKATLIQAEVCYDQ